MKASIILCTHRSERYEDFVEAIDSLLSQSYNNLEIVVVVDGNKELYARISKSGIEEADKVKDKVKVILNEENMGLSESRNKGIKEAKGDITAFFDDDAVADEEWVEERERERMYEEKEAIVAGGEILPKWIQKDLNSCRRSITG
ncbi:MAG: glycosyltransferase family 2 protein [Halobacteriota archaeon]